MGLANSVSQDSDEFLVISNNIEPEIIFEPSQSTALIFGIDEQLHSNYRDKSIGKTAKLDALETSIAISEHLHIKSSSTFCSSENPQDCSQSGILSHIESCSSHVGPQGVMVIFFGGHGVNDDDRKWALAPADFDRSSNTYITAGHISTCMERSNCQAKAVLLILDCCYSGMLGLELTSNIDNHLLPNLYVMAAGTAHQSSFSVLSLQHSIFSYFLKLGLAIHSYKDYSVGTYTLPLTKIYEFCHECTSALSSLILTLDNYDIKTKHVTPSLLHLDPKIEVGVEEVDAAITLTEQPGRLGFVFDLFDDTANKPCPPRPKLHNFTHKWLQSLVMGNYQPLYLMRSRRLFDSDTNKDGSELLVTVIALIVQSIAVLELYHNSDSVGNPDTFLLSFIQTVSVVDFFIPNCRIDYEHVVHSWAMYTRVLKTHNVNDESMMELFEKIKPRLSNTQVCILSIMYVVVCVYYI